MVKRYFNVDIGDTVFLVFADKVHRKMTANIVIEMTVDHIYINENGTVYTAKTKRVVVGKGIEKDVDRYVRYFSFKDDNIDTGFHTIKYIYPVFTTKQKCIEYLKG